ncbi:hypothetical protein ACFVWY_14185 [Streptomyces sp. NPDC058195]|uniref:hypothetical protein n=1 Tax=Streptomyces sp. NPDC058195 TaxID=3346375 RepID=UPI0036E5C50D
MIREVLGPVIALTGAAAAVLSPFRDWYDGRPGREYRVGELFTQVTAGRPEPLGSMLLVFLCAALLAVLGVLLRSRWAVAVAGTLVLGFTVLWMVRQGQAAGSLAIAGDGSGLGWGVAGALAGGALMVVGALVMPGRRRSARAGAGAPFTAPDTAHPDTWPPTQEPGPSVQTSTLPEPEPELYTGPEPGGPDDVPDGPDGGPGDSDGRGGPDGQGGQGVRGVRGGPDDAPGGPDDAPERTPRPGT